MLKYYESGMYQDKYFLLIQIQDDHAQFCTVQAVDKGLFKRLQEIHGTSFQSFIARKLVPVIGDIREANLGSTQEFAHRIQDEVDIIINSAGNTTFHERYGS